ncbi:hypothetical protein EDD21DRAFT_373766 [Dissophora ornata]|nr:hypothetical protein EDD21DRAFT_373766 [Dissophora ornata]
MVLLVVALVLVLVLVLSVLQLVDLHALCMVAPLIANYLTIFALRIWLIGDMVRASMTLIVSWRCTVGIIAVITITTSVIAAAIGVAIAAVCEPGRKKRVLGSGAALVAMCSCRELMRCALELLFCGQHGRGQTGQRS